jgi:hypothetical protein
MWETFLEKTMNEKGQIATQYEDIQEELAQLFT